MIVPFRRNPIPPALAALLALVLLAPPGAAPRPACADDRAVTRELPPSNTALLARASRAAAQRLVADVPLTPGTRIGLRAEGESKLDGDMREALLQAFNARQITCVLLEPVGGARDTAVTFAEPAAAADTPPPPAAGGSLADLSARAAAAQQAGTSEFERLQAEREAQATRADSIRAARGAGHAGGSTGGPAASAVTAPRDLPVITWRVQEARVDYVREYRNGIFGSHRVERRARADLALRLTPAGSDAVAWSAAADTAIGDVVLKSELAGLEDRTRPETRPVLPQSSFKKVLEPVLVVVLVAGLVSLFYQNRP